MQFLTHFAIFERGCGHILGQFILLIQDYVRTPLPHLQIPNPPKSLKLLFIRNFMLKNYFFIRNRISCIYFTRFLQSLFYTLQHKFHKNRRFYLAVGYINYIIIFFLIVMNYRLYRQPCKHRIPLQKQHLPQEPLIHFDL